MQYSKIWHFVDLLFPLQYSGGRFVKQRGILMRICAHCWKLSSIKTMGRHIYVVTKRGRPLSNKKFCALKCLTDHLITVEPNWEAIGESVCYDLNGLSVHTIIIAEKKKIDEHIRYRG